MKTAPGLILFEDEHLLVVNKPAGVNTHSPAPYAGEGIYDWLRHREPRWAPLSILHRLDKDTSGVMVFGKSTLANKSLTSQFAGHSVRKRYILRTDRPVPSGSLVAESALVRVGDRYVSRPLHAGAERAETRFRIVSRSNGENQVEAEPVTGRTHQIRVHAAEHGFPILGDSLYGGSPAGRLFLHAASLRFRHPAEDEEVTFEAPARFELDARLALRSAIVDPAETDACRLVHGAGDGWPGWFVERLGDFILSQSEQPLTDRQAAYLATMPAVKSVYHKLLDRHVRRSSVGHAGPQWVLGERAPDRFVVSENGLKFELSFSEGYSVGLFLDQRDNRRRLLTGHVAAGFPLFERATGCEVLNAFAYTCGFSVCAAKSGARTTSLDLSKKYLEWGRRNLILNGIDPGSHDFIHGDVFEWFRRLGKKQRAYDLIVLDPPTFSQSKEHGTFRAEKDYGGLLAAALPLLRRGGIVLASTNAAGLDPERFVESLHEAAVAAGRTIVARHYVPQPLDFPVSRNEPAYLKTIWLRFD